MPLQGGLTVLVLGGHQGKGQGATTSGGGCHWALEALSSRPKLEGTGELFSVLWMQEAIHGIPLAPIPQFMEEEMRGPERQSDFPKATQPSTPLSLSLSLYASPCGSYCDAVVWGPSACPAWTPDAAVVGK